MYGFRRSKCKAYNVKKAVIFRNFFPKYVLSDCPSLYIYIYIYIYGGCPKYLFPDSPQSLSQSRSNRGTTVSNRGRVCSSLIRSFTKNISYVLYNEDPCVNAFDFKFGNKISSRGPETVRKTHSSTSSSSTSSTSRSRSRSRSRRS